METTSTSSDGNGSRATWLGQPAPQPEALDGVVGYYEAHPITSHPFMQRLARDEVNLEHLWCLLANFQISISASFAGHLASIVDRIPDGPVRAILAQQLHDELGRGVPDDAHTRLFADMMGKLAPFRPTGGPPELMVAGERLAPTLAEIYAAPDLNEVLGAIVAGEVFGKQMDQFIAEQFRRQSQVETSHLVWLTLHEALEVEHADDSLELVRLLPTHALPAVWRGANRIAEAGAGFLDDLGRFCHGKS